MPACPFCGTRYNGSVPIMLCARLDTLWKVNRIIRERNERETQVQDS